jgi:hypothetical protein
MHHQRWGACVRGSCRRARTVVSSPRGRRSRPGTNLGGGVLLLLLHVRRLRLTLAHGVRGRGARCAIGNRTGRCAAGPVPRSRGRPGGVAQGSRPARARGQGHCDGHRRSSQGRVEGPSTYRSRVGERTSSAQVRLAEPLVGGPWLSAGRLPVGKWALARGPSEARRGDGAMLPVLRGVARVEPADATGGQESEGVVRPEPVL